MAVQAEEIDTNVLGINFAFIISKNYLSFKIVDLIIKSN